MKNVYYTMSCVDATLVGNDLPVTFDRYHQSQADSLCFCSLRERVNVDQLNDQLEVIEEHLQRSPFPTKKLRLLLNNTVALDHIKNKHIFDRIDLLDYFACFSIFKTHHAEQQVNQRWNLHANRALYLMGKPYSHHRLGVLYHFTQDPQFMQTLEYSYDPYLKYTRDPAPDRLLRTRDLYYQYEPNGDYEAFALKYQRFIDVFDPGDQIHSEVGCPYEGFIGFPYDVSLYADSLFSIISETDQGEAQSTEQSIWLTEKTWRAIINHHPFVLFDLKGHKHRYLNDLGIRTFEDYYTHSFSDIQQQADSKIQSRMYAENCVNFREHILADTHSVDARIRHNAAAVREIVDNYVADVFDKDTEAFLEFLANTGYSGWNPPSNKV